MSDNFKQEREAAVSAFNHKRALEIDARLVKIGLGEMVQSVFPIGPDGFVIKLDEWRPNVNELLEISMEFGTTAVQVQLDDSLNMEIYVDGVTR